MGINTENMRNNASQDQGLTEAEKVLGSMPNYTEFTKERAKSESETILQLYEAFAFSGKDGDRRNAEGAIARASRENGKSIFENLCDEINSEHIGSNEGLSEDFGAFDVASSIITANCIKMMEDNNDKEIGCAEALIFQNKAEQKIAHPDAYPTLMYDGQVLEEITNRYKTLRGNGKIDQSFDGYLASLSNSYGLMAYSAQNSGNDEYMTPEQIAEWKSINRIIKNCQYLKEGQLKMDKDFLFPIIEESQEGFHAEQINEPISTESTDVHSDTMGTEGIFDQQTNTGVGDNIAGIREKQKHLSEQMEQKIEGTRRYLNNAESLIQKMSSSNISPSVQELQTITRGMIDLSEQVITKIDERAGDKEFLDLLYDYFQMKLATMLDDGVKVAEDICDGARQLLHNTSMHDFLEDARQVSTLFESIKQELV